MSNTQKHQPKGSMCMACVKQHNDCSTLDFKAMPVLMRLPEEIFGAQVIVKCTQFEAGSRAECANVIPLPIKSDLERRHNTTPKQFQDLVRPLFLWMHEHGVDTVSIERDGPLGNVTINGKPI